MSEEKALEYRGDVRGLAARGSTIAWVTQHPQKMPSAVYRLDGESMSLTDVELPAGAVSILADEKGMWVGGDDARLYQVTPKAKKPKEIAELPAPAIALATLSDKRLAAICAAQLVIIDASKGSVLQSIDLSDQATALATDPAGEWIAVGSKDGTVAVFECEEKDSFQISESEKLHNGSVTAILFQAAELRFFSAGTDKKLLLTHARGRLEPEDRGRSNNHAERVTSMLLVPGERFITGSRDKSCKTWARVGATKPATQDDGISEVVDMALCEIHGRTQLAIACSDNSIRFFLIDTGGRFGAATQRITDAYSRAQQLLAHRDAVQRGAGMTSLADYDDNRSVEMLAQHIHDEVDHKLRVRATELLCKSECPLSAKLLEPLLKNEDMVVRESAFAGLCDKAPTGDLEPMTLALASGHHNVGTLAIQRLTQLAAKDEIAHQTVVQAISHKLPEVRIEAQLQLESLLDSDSPEANLTAIASNQSDARTLGLVRLYQRKMIELPRVQAAIRRAFDDGNAHVRQHAFAISVLAQKKLAAAIRFRDEDLHRQFHALETIGKAKSKSKDLPKPKKSSLSVPADELDPLLTAMASRATDTALLGARCLAMLGDARSLGMLLQLSREEDAKVRREVCLALADLGDSRATDRLETMLDDDAETVRDAAFTAFTKLTDDDPLTAAESGLSSAHEDVRRRALKALVSFMRKSAKNKKNGQARELLVRSLNDSEPSVRSEAFKASLNINVEGSEDKTLRFVLGSVHADIRREVLTEAIANEKQDWAQELLRDLFSDADADIRKEAFDHVIDKSKKRDIEPMQIGLQSAFADIRQSAVAFLIQTDSAESLAALTSAVSDVDADVRKAALAALVDRDSTEALAQALESEHKDTRLTAAVSLAAHGDSRCRQVLLEFATADEEESNERWWEQAAAALEGLAELGDSSVATSIEPLLSHEDGRMVAKALQVFAGFLDGSGAPQLEFGIQHGGSLVQLISANGLAICGDTSVMPLVFDRLTTVKARNPVSLLASAVLFGNGSERQLINVLNRDGEFAWARKVALIVLLGRDWLNHDGTPRRAIAALSSKMPVVRLFAAQAVDRFHDQDAFSKLIIELFNERNDQLSWEVSSETITEVISTLLFGPRAICNRLIVVLQSLSQAEQFVWDRRWATFRKRFENEIRSAQAARPKLPKVSIERDELTQIAFGTYVGLVREQGGYHERGNRPSFGATVIAIRETAIRRLIEITGDDAVRQAAARPVLVQALGDPNQAVRDLAFNQLPSLGIDNDARAFAAIESGHVDLAVQGMKLLTSDAKIATVRQVLKDVILSRTDRLAGEAAVLLAEKTDRVEAAEVALNSPSAPLRREVIRWLVKDYDESAKAKKLLRSALDSKYQRVRLHAATGLADKKDPRAYDALVELLRKDDALKPHLRIELEQAFRKLGDARAADAMMDRIENDPEKTARTGVLFSLVSEYRNADNVDRLLEMMKNSEWCSHASSALLTISGFDQYVEDPFDDREDQSWLEQQHPRNDDVLAKLIEQHLELDSSPRQIMGLVEDNARWSQSSAVDDVLGRLTTHSDEALRNVALFSVGWRLKHRNGPSDALLEALESRDPRSKFIAADGLARAGRDDGIAVVMSAVELSTELPDRIRAVEALGMLADPRALELLLRLAGDDLHALQAVAATAIGNLSETNRSDEVFAILKRLVKEPCSSTHNALVGLRHFASADAWQLLREHATTQDMTGEHALVQLSYNDDPATKDLYLEMLSGEMFLGEALHASRRLFGIDSLEPDYATLAAEFYYSIDIEWEYHCAERVSKDGDATRILEVIHHCDEDTASLLSTSLLNRDPLPVEGAAAALESPHAETIALAAHIVGRGGEKSSGKSIESALTTTLQRWNDSHDYSLQRGEEPEDLETINQALSKLCWAANRTSSAKTKLIEIAQSHVAEHRFASNRVSAIEALAEMKLTKTDLGKLKELVNDHNSNIRRKVAELIVANDVKTDSVFESALSDQGVFRTIVAAGIDTKPLVTPAIRQPNQQAIVLSQAVRGNDVTLLYATATDTGLGDNTRLGAIEGLGQIANKDSLKQLAAIGSDDSTDEELRKAAWRSYRRSKRLQEKAK